MRRASPATGATPGASPSSADTIAAAVRVVRNPIHSARGQKRFAVLMLQKSSYSPPRHGRRDVCLM